MTVWKVILILLLVLLLLGMIRVGGEAEYSREGFSARVRVGAFRIPIYPPKKEKKEAEAERGKETEKDGADRETKKRGGSLALVEKLLPLVGEALGGLKGCIRIDDLQLELTVGGRGDAAGSVMTFGYANAAAGALLAFFENCFDLKEYRVHTDIDFNTHSPTVYVLAALSGRIGAFLLLGARLGLKFLKIYCAYQKENEAKAKAAAKQ